jgi:cullin 3
VLRKHPPGRDVKDEDFFSFNEGFHSDLHKIKIAVVAAKVESGEERKETRERIDEERKHQTDVCRFYSPLLLLDLISKLVRHALSG